MRLSTGFPIAVLAALSAFPAAAQDAASYPSRQISIVVPFPAGGPQDIIARSVAQKLNAAWGQPVIVENRPGAGGNIGMDYVAKSAPDGYTIVESSFGPLVISPFVYSKLPYDPIKDLAPITLAATSFFFIATQNSVPAANLKEFIAWAGKNAKGVAYSSSGNATPSHLGGALFQSLTNTKLVHVPYKGSAGSVPALMSGEVEMLVESPPLLVPLARDGKVKVLAFAGPARSPLLPNVPTTAEAGLKGAEVGSWYGFHAPARTPRPIVDKLHGEIVKALNDPELKARLAGIGSDIVAGTPDEYAAFIAGELKKWEGVIKSTGIRMD